MRVLSCIEENLLLEFISIPQELPLTTRFGVRLHLIFCRKCAQKKVEISSLWQKFFSPVPELSSSLIRVYSKLQNDETLILKGWRLASHRRARQWSDTLVQGGWLFRGAISLGLVGLVSFAIYSQLKSADFPQPHMKIRAIPMAQIRFEQPNHVQVHYVTPELLESVEFETTNGGAE